MEDTFAVYVPNPEGTMPLDIIPRSGIVGTPTKEWGPDHASDSLTLDYEGNLYGAGAIKTLADRVMIAASRHAEHYPTVARQMAHSSDVIRVATYYPTHRRVEIVPADLDISGGEAIVLLTRWLALDPDIHLSTELRCS